MSMLAPVVGDEEGSLKPAMGAFNDCRLSSESLKEGTVAPLTLVGGASGCPDWNARVNKACKPRESGACDDDLRARRHRLPPPCMINTWPKYTHFNETKCTSTHGKRRDARVGGEECECRTRFLASERLDCFLHKVSFVIRERQYDGCKEATGWNATTDRNLRRGRALVAVDGR